MQVLLSDYRLVEGSEARPPQDRDEFDGSGKRQSHDSAISSLKRFDQPAADQLFVSPMQKGGAGLSYAPRGWMESPAATGEPAGSQDGPRGRHRHFPVFANEPAVWSPRRSQMRWKHDDRLAEVSEDHLLVDGTAPWSRQRLWPGPSGQLFNCTHRGASTSFGWSPASANLADRRCYRVSPFDKPDDPPRAAPVSPRSAGSPASPRSRIRFTSSLPTAFITPIRSRANRRERACRNPRSRRRLPEHPPVGRLCYGPWSPRTRPAALRLSGWNSNGVRPPSRRPESSDGLHQLPPYR